MKHLAGTAVLLVTLTSGCSLADDEVSAAIGSALRDPGLRELRLAAVTPFDWDDVFIFDAYTPRADICRVLKVERMECEQTVPFESTQDGVMTLIFRSGTRVIRCVKHSRRNGDFAPTPKKQPVSASEAVFSVRRADAASGGNLTLELKNNEASDSSLEPSPSSVPPQPASAGPAADLALAVRHATRSVPAWLERRA